jgi:DNA repair photolyase
VVFSGVTDCYQPLEASYQLTRRCLQVCAEAATPAAVITKAPLVERDIDVLLRLAEVAESHVTISIPFWDPVTARAIEPYVATPERRLRTVQRLAAAGISVGVNVAPIIPGLNDQDMPRILTAAREAGASSAGYVLLRLPGSVREVFVERLRKNLPLAADRVLHLIRETRGGELYDPRFKIRGRGEGPYAAAIGQLFKNTAARLGLQSGHGMDTGGAAEGKKTYSTPVATPELQPKPPAKQDPQEQPLTPEPPGAQLSLQFPRGASAAGNNSAQSEQSGNIPAR